MDLNFVNFILNNTHLKSDEIKHDLKLKQDLGYHDLDFDGFIADFCDKFNVVINSKPIFYKGEKDLTISDLEKSVSSKTLFI